MFLSDHGETSQEDQICLQEGSRPSQGKYDPSTTAVPGGEELKESTRNKASPAHGEQASTSSVVLALMEASHVQPAQIESTFQSHLHFAFESILVLMVNCGCVWYFCNSQHMKPHWENPNQ